MGPGDDLALGDLVEFRSGAGYWKPGVVDAVLRRTGGRRSGVRYNVRIRVGEGVYVIRPVEACRRRRAT